MSAEWTAGVFADVYRLNINGRYVGVVAKRGNVWRSIPNVGKSSEHKTLEAAKRQLERMGRRMQQGPM